MKFPRVAVTTVCAVSLMLGLGAAPTSATTDGRSASCAGAVSWKSAGQLAGRVATVRGFVVSTKYASYSNGSPTFLDLGAAYPSSRRFTVVIWGRNRANFRTPESRYYRRTICVRGLIARYDDHYQIEAQSRSQIALG